MVLIPRISRSRHRTLRASSLLRRWSSGRIRPCHGRDPGSIPGRRIGWPRTSVGGQLDLDYSRSAYFLVFWPPKHTVVVVVGIIFLNLQGNLKKLAIFLGVLLAILFSAVGAYKIQCHLIVIQFSLPVVHLELQRGLENNLPGDISPIRQK